MLSELYTAFYEEVLGSSSAQLRFVAEIVQAAIIVGAVWVIAIGWGERKGFVLNMLNERRAKVRAHLETASRAEQDLAHAKQISALKVRSANADARRTIADAKLEAEQYEAKAKSDADTEAERITQRAESALETELAEMSLEIREELVDLVAQATRAIMNEKMTVAEQRKLIEDTIIANVARAKEDNRSAAAGARQGATS